MPLLDRVASLLKQSYRWIRYPEWRRRVVRDRRVRRAQAVSLRREHDRSASSLIAFVVPGANPDTGAENLWGGVLAICGICEETKRMSSLSGADVVLCTLPGDTPLLRHTLFPSDTDVYGLDQVLDYFTNLRSLSLHVPEYAAATLATRLEEQQIRCLAGIESLHINVMNQNIDLMPSPQALDDLRRLATHMTMTTAHRQYCTPELARRYRMPVHHLSVPVDTDTYSQLSFIEKDDLVLFSPDDPAKNREVKAALTAVRPELEFVEIRGLPYADYRRLLERARFMFTFGEGLDYYFVESILSGGVAFAVFNDRFFTPEFLSLRTVYSSFEDLRSRLAVDFQMLSDPGAHAHYREAQLAVVNGVLSLSRFRDNLRLFLGGDYTWSFDEPAARA